jgi:hypothetical protein
MPDILEEMGRDFLLRRKNDGNSTPFFGSVASSEKVPVSSQIANKLTKRSDCLMEDYFYELHIEVYYHNCHEFIIE